MDGQEEGKKMIDLRKGTWGYYQRKKIFQLLMCFLCVAAIFIFVIIGYLVTSSTQNLFTVVAVLSALPLANFAVVYIAVFPYKSRSKTDYDNYRSQFKNGAFLAELAITSTNEPTLGVDYGYVHARGIVLVTLLPIKGDLKKKTAFIEGILAANGFQVPVVVFTDIKSFLKRSHALNEFEMTEAEAECLEPMAELLRNISI